MARASTSVSPPADLPAADATIAPPPATSALPSALSPSPVSAIVGTIRHLGTVRPSGTGQALTAPSPRFCGRSGCVPVVSGDATRRDQSRASQPAALGARDTPHRSDAGAPSRPAHCSASGHESGPGTSGPALAAEPRAPDRLRDRDATEAAGHPGDAKPARRRHGRSSRHAAGSGGHAAFCFPAARLGHARPEHARWGHPPRGAPLPRSARPATLPCPGRPLRAAGARHRQLLGRPCPPVRPLLGHPSVRPLLGHPSARPPRQSTPARLLRCTRRRPQRRRRSRRPARAPRPRPRQPLRRSPGSSPPAPAPRPRPRAARRSALPGRLELRDPVPLPRYARWHAPSPARTRRPARQEEEQQQEQERRPRRVVVAVVATTQTRTSTSCCDACARSRSNSASSSTTPSSP